MSGESLNQRRDFRSLVDHLDGVTIWFVSEHGQFEYISAGFEDMWGIPASEIKHNPACLLETIHPDDRERVRSQLDQSESDVAETSYVARVVRPDESVRWVQTRHFPLRDDAGNLTTIVGISTDITDQKRRERELDVLNRLLRHDIRNAINVILGRAELLKDSISEDGQEQLQQILETGNRITELTEVAGNYAKTVTRDDELEMHPVSLRPTLQHAIEVRREAFPDAEFRITGELPDVEVMANELLESIFTNLLNNAVQHNDKAEPVVEIQCKIADDTVEILITDNGPGIPDHQKQSIFEKGEMRVDSPGTGIGLHLVHTLVTQYGGSIRLEDNSPVGTIFSVKLNRAD